MATKRGWLTIRHLGMIAALAMVTFLLGACGEDPTAIPAATAAPPAATATVAPPTNTPAPGVTPVATAAPATAAPATQAPAATAEPPEPTPTLGEPYFEGKTLRFIVCCSPGGGQDFFARLLARFLPPYLPGDPAAIVQNRPGAAGLVAANYTYNQAKPDGLTLGNVLSPLAVNQIAGSSGVAFDLAKFHWLINLEGASFTCYVRSDTGIRTLDDLRNAPEPIPMAAPQGVTTMMLTLMKEDLGANVQLIRGYSGSTSEEVLAVEQGEVLGACKNWPAVGGARPDWIATNFVTPIFQFASAPGDPSVPPGVPTVTDVRSQVNETSYAAMLIAASATQFAYGYATHPNTPVDVVNMLQDGFWQAANDPAFIAAAQPRGFLVTPTHGADMQVIMTEALNASAEVRAKVIELLGG